MPRTISGQLAALLALPHLETQSTLVLTYTKGMVKRVATADLMIDGENFTPDLRRVGEIQQSLSKTVDRVGVVLQNIDKLFGAGVAGAGSALDMAEAVVGRFFHNPRDETQTAHANLFRGRVTSVSADENQVTFDVISDIVAAGLCVSPRTLAQKCCWRFKSPECGYVGPLQTCNKILKSEGGCLGRNNTHRFGGWTFPLPPEPSVPGTGGNQGGGEVLPCFTRDTLILMSDGSEQPIAEVEVGDSVLAFDETESVVPVRVARKFAHIARAIYKVRLESGTELEVTPEHLIYLGKDYQPPFRAMREIDKGFDLKLWTSGGGWRSSKIVEKILIRQAVKVFNLHVEPCNTFFAGGIAVHNAKVVRDYENMP